MTIGIVELVLVFGAVLGLAVVDLLRTRSSTTRTASSSEDAERPTLPPRRKTSGPANPRTRKPRVNRS